MNKLKNFDPSKLNDRQIKLLQDSKGDADLDPDKVTK